MDRLIDSASQAKPTFLARERSELGPSLAHYLTEPQLVQRRKQSYRLLAGAPHVYAIL